jgi:hypothetical protein
MEKLVAPESNFGDNTTVHSVISERKSMLQVQLQSREAESKIIEDEIDCGDEGISLGGFRGKLNYL